MLIGYARVSTQDQTLDLQTDALTRAGCDKIFTDTASGAKIERPGLAEAISHLRSGDTLVVWRLDRLVAGWSSRSFKWAGARDVGEERGQFGRWGGG
jgi:DNA invertase Pin-like site-specific DNA recombinase